MNVNEFLKDANLPPALITLMWAAAIVAVIWLAKRFVKSSVTKSIQDTDRRYRVRKVVDFLSYVLIILALLIVYSEKLAGITVALGVAGAGIAFALQEVIASVAGWIAIMSGGFYKTGDRVQLGGIKGDVIDIGMIRTTVMEIGEWVDGDLYNGRIVRVANSFVFKEPVFNYSGDFRFLWDEVKIPIRFGSDYAMARQLLNDIAQQHLSDYSAKAAEAWEELVQNYRIENAQIAPMLTMVFDDNWVTFTLRYVVNYKRRRMTKDLLFTSIMDEVGKTNGKVQLASATFELVAAPDINVAVKNK